ncbi:hypothetical protein Tco_1407088 [Tanacetum coccineum]
MSTGDLLATLLNQFGLNNSSAANASKNKEVKPSQFPAPITNPNLVAYQAFGPIGPSYFAPPAPMYGPAPTYIQAQAGVPSGQATILPHAFTVGSLHDLTTGAWNMDTGASSHLNDSVTNLSEVFNSYMYSSVSVGDGHFIPVTNTGHSILPTSVRPLHLNNVLITPNIVKNLISVRQFIRDNNCTIEFDAYGFSVKDFMTRRFCPPPSPSIATGEL